MSKKVMIADDDAAIVDFLSILLQLEGYDITSTLNGATLLEMDDDLPDLIILDIWMSGVDGRDVCKQLKQQEHTRNIGTDPKLALPTARGCRIAPCCHCGRWRSTPTGFVPTAAG